MANMNRNFIGGAMEKDLDERLLPQGKYRHALNVLVQDSEGADTGAVNKSYSNKKLTDFDFGPNPVCLLGIEEESTDTFYYAILSDTGAYIMEWDQQNEILSMVLGDTRVGAERVLNLHKDFLITGIQVLVTEDYSRRMLLFTDDNMQPCCINIARAKTYGINGFEKEDIYLIKKPPRYAPVVTLTYSNDRSNNLEDRFLLFAYRYRYLDGEYSALSSFTNYNFSPKKFELDFFTLVNNGMVNKFNAVNVVFNTGEKQVVEIQLVAKESNSNNLYVIETFSKADQGWADEEIKNFIFSNQKLYTVLPEKELFRTFDNVPLKAKALSLIGNIPVLSNYVEGFDIVDDNNNKIVIDYDITLISTDINDVDDLTTSIPNPNQFTFETNENVEYVQDYVLVFNFNIAIGAISIYRNDFTFVLPQSYDNINDLVSSPDFVAFTEVINQNFIANYNNDNAYNVDPDYALSIETSILFSVIAGVPTFTVTPITFLDTANGDAPVVVDLSFDSDSNVFISNVSNTTSVKTNRNLQVGLLYMDEFGRCTTTLTSKNNTIFVPQQYSVFKNSLRVTLNNKPPFWADRYKFVVKTQPLVYQTIFVNEFYNEDNFVWAKLVADNKDKVKVGDTLIVKVAGSTVISDPIRVKVLEIKEFSKDFIEENQDEDGNDIIESAGLYMKIRPNGFIMNVGDYEVKQNEASGESNGFPVFYLNLFTTPGTPNQELSIPEGSSIYLYINSERYFDDGPVNITYEKTFFAQTDYDTLEDWFNAILLNGSFIPGVVSTTGATENYAPNLSLVRGNIIPTPSQPYGGFTPNPDGNLYLQIIGLRAGGTRNRKGRGRARIVIRLSTGIYVFETNPLQSESEIYYETDQVFDIVNGNHLGNVSSQDNDAFTPAVVDLNFFNCYTQGNGVESFRVRDEFNSKFLNIDTRPSAVSVEPYRQVRRFADMSFGEPFVESSNINGLNVFNLSTFNFKELDKQYGSIQKTYSRDGDIIVLQEEKASKVLFNKDLLYSADGDPTVSLANKVLGQQVFYLGDNGIGKSPESFAVNDFQMFYLNSLKGNINRLSNDGVTVIMNGMNNYFRDLFIAKPFSKKLGGFDPHHKQYFVSFDEEPIRVYNANCGNTLIKSNINNILNYRLNLNNLVGDIVLNYNITMGSVTITATHDEGVTVASNVSGTGNLTIERSNLNANFVDIVVVPVDGQNVSYSITNLCPVGVPLRVFEVIANDDLDNERTISNRYRWSGSNYFTTDDVFTEAPLTRFSSFTGTEGVGRCPQNGSVVRLESYKKATNTGRLSLLECNRIGYLVTDVVYTESDLNTIMEEATFLDVTTTALSINSFIEAANFLFERTSENQHLYLIWDYTDRRPVILNLNINVQIGDSITVNVLPEGASSDEYTVLVPVQPLHGVAVANTDGTITYTHNGSDNFDDSFNYLVSTEKCSSTARIDVSVGVSCSAGINASGGIGIYEAIVNVGTELGLTGVKYNAIGVPDRFQVFYNNVLVADSKYVGDSIAAGPPTSYPGLLGVKSGFNIFNYVGGSFVNTGNIEPDFTVTQSDIADNITEPTDGNGVLLFNKTTATPTNIKIRAIGPVGSTAWNISGICPLDPSTLIDGEEKFVYGFFSEANKGNTSKSMKVFLGSSPVKFYVNILEEIDFAIFGYNSTSRFMNDGTTWWELDPQGFILNTGTL